MITMHKISAIVFFFVCEKHVKEEEEGEHPGPVISFDN